jgi:hypothetical protein
VLDPEGRELGSSRSKGSDTLGRGRPDRRDLDTAFNSILASLFSAPSIAQALSDEAAPVAASTARCTVDQILKMKESGLGEDQIRAACGEVGR